MIENFEDKIKNEIYFKVIDLSDIKEFKKALKNDPAKTDNSSFATNYLWEKYYNISYAVIENCIVIRYIIDGIISFAFPFGGSNEEKILAVKSLSRFCKKQDISFRLGPVTIEDKMLMEKELSGLFSFSKERSVFEYVYRKEKLIKLDEFSDLKYKKKLINKLKDSGNLKYEKLESQNMELCMQIEDLWLSERMKYLQSQKSDGSLNQEDFEEKKSLLNSEHELILKAFANFDALDLFGGFLTLNGKPIAFTIAEEQTEDTVIVHIEKALKGIKGAYQAINNFFVTESCKKYKFINREEDNGEENLRQSKMSYRPDKLVEIYSAVELKPTFRFLEKDEYQTTKSIFKLIFSGEENAEFFDEFFKEKVYNTRIAVLELETRNNNELEKKVIAITQIWNIKVSSSNSDLNKHHQLVKYEKYNTMLIPYFYATGTLPEYRLLGFRNMLFNELFSVFKKEGVKWTFLAPKNKNIWGSLGFNISFDASEEEKEILEIDDDIDICLVHEIVPDSFSRPLKIENSFV